MKVEQLEIEKKQTTNKILKLDLESLLQNIFQESIELKQKVQQEGQAKVIIKMAECLVQSFKKGGKLLICGNGGSAADAQHLAAELLIRLRPHMNRQAIPAIALAMDSSTLTACGNDFGFEVIYERLVSGLGQSNDVLLGITTSGRSKNVIRALKMAKSMGIATLGFLGCEGGEALQYCDHAFVVPDQNVARIQEVHITAGHALMEMVEELLLVDEYISAF